MCRRIVDVGGVQVAGRGRRAGRAIGDPAGLDHVPAVVPLITAASLVPWMVIGDELSGAVDRW